MSIQDPPISELCELLSIGQFALGCDQFGLLLSELRLELWPEGNEGFRLGEASLEFTHMPCVVRAFRLQNTDFGAELLQFSVVNYSYGRDRS